jgi:hypothetical protein
VSPCRPCTQRMDGIEDKHPRLGKVLRPVHNAAMRHLPAGVIERGSRIVGLVVDRPDRSAEAFEREHGRKPRRSL